MKTLVKSLMSVLVITFLLLGCSDDPISTDGPDFSISEMAGNWTAIQASLYSAALDQGVQIIVEGGTLSLQIQSNGRFTMNVDPVDRAAYTVTGKMFFEDGEFFAIAFDKYPGEYEYFGVTLTATTLRILGGPDTAEYDFGNDGTFESTNLHLEFIKD